MELGVSVRFGALRFTVIDRDIELAAAFAVLAVITTLLLLLLFICCCCGESRDRWHGNRRCLFMLLYRLLLLLLMTLIGPLLLLPAVDTAVLMPPLLFRLCWFCYCCFSTYFFSRTKHTRQIQRAFPMVVLLFQPNIYSIVLLLKIVRYFVRLRDRHWHSQFAASHYGERGCQSCDIAIGVDANRSLRFASVNRNTI